MLAIYTFEELVKARQEEDEAFAAYMKCVSRSRLIEAAILTNKVTKEWVSVTEAAQICKCSQSAIHRRIEKGLLEVRKNVAGRREVKASTLFTGKPKRETIPIEF